MIVHKIRYKPKNCKYPKKHQTCRLQQQIVPPHKVPIPPTIHQSAVIEHNNEHQDCFAIGAVFKFH